jgi:hypothetical protein
MTGSVKPGELEILERHNVVILAKHWEAFLRWVIRSPQELPELKALANTKPA